MAIHVGRWDCNYCGHRGNLGPEKQCSACGNPRGNDVKFYLPEDGNTVTDQTQIIQAKAGPDWTCDYCGTSNIYAAPNCHTCGNEKTAADRNLNTQTYDLNKVPGSGVQTANNTQVTPRISSAKNYNWIVIIGLVLLTCAGFQWLLTPRIIDLSVTGHRWKRTVAVENYHPVRREDWNVPGGAEIINRFQAIHHYDRVFDHYETRTRMVKVKIGEERYVSGKRDMGNGYFEDVYSTRPVYQEKNEKYQESIYRDVPVYQTKYIYRVYEWSVDHTAVALQFGTDCYWPEGAPQNKNWRDGNKTEIYTLFLQDKKGKKYEIDIDYNRWRTLKEWNRVKARKTVSEIELIDYPEK